MIEEEHIRFVAAADVTDDCRVEVVLRKARQTLTPSQAVGLSVELARAAMEASNAAEELLHDHEPASFDVAILSPHEVRQEIPWPPHPEATYMLSRWSCACGWQGLPFKDTKANRVGVDAAAAEAREHEAGTA